MWLMRCRGHRTTTNVKLLSLIISPGIGGQKQLLFRQECEVSSNFWCSAIAHLGCTFNNRGTESLPQDLCANNFDFYITGIYKLSLSLSLSLSLWDNHTLWLANRERVCELNHWRRNGASLSRQPLSSVLNKLVNDQENNRDQFIPGVLHVFLSNIGARLDQANSSLSYAWTENHANFARVVNLQVLWISCPFQGGSKGDGVKGVLTHPVPHTYNSFITLR